MITTGTTTRQTPPTFWEKRYWWFRRHFWPAAVVKNVLIMGPGRVYLPSHSIVRNVTLSHGASIKTVSGACNVLFDQVTFYAETGLTDE